MRLINADKLKEAINSSLNTGRETLSPEIMCEAVDEQPTAFDVERLWSSWKIEARWQDRILSADFSETLI